MGVLRSAAADGAAPTLHEYYASLGLPEEAWHIGPEHPSLEDLGIRLLARCRTTRILEIGVQSGGFAVPVILAAWQRSGFSYTGIDNLEYTNAVRLHLIAEFLARHGVSRGVHFYEGDSSATLRTLPADSFDLVLLDHYKPKYPLDLFIACERRLLSAGGAIVLHDVLAHAAPQWRVCRRVCRAFGYEWTIDSDVSQGAAIVRRTVASRPSTVRKALVWLEVQMRWTTHAALLHARRRAGRVLRSLHLR